MWENIMAVWNIIWLFQQLKHLYWLAMHIVYFIFWSENPFLTFQNEQIDHN